MEAVKKSHVLVVLVLSILTTVYSASPAVALSPLTTLDTKKIRNVGKDPNEMLWYVVEYGTQDGVPFAVARSYYTNETVKQARITELLSHNVSPEMAGALYFSEYGYEFTSDGTQASTAYIAHGTQNAMTGHIRVTEQTKAWNSVRDSFAAGKAAEILFPRPAPRRR